jgi:hypothetical protein
MSWRRVLTPAEYAFVQDRIERVISPVLEHAAREAGVTDAEALACFGRLIQPLLVDGMLPLDRFDHVVDIVHRVRAELLASNPSESRDMEALKREITVLRAEVDRLRGNASRFA